MTALPERTRPTRAERRRRHQRVGNAVIVALGGAIAVLLAVLIAR